MVNDSLAGQNLIVVAVAEAGAARAYRRGANTFSPAQAGTDREPIPALLDRNGARWRLEEEALVRVDDPNQRLKRLPGHLAYWFG